MKVDKERNTGVVKAVKKTKSKIKSLLNIPPKIIKKPTRFFVGKTLFEQDHRMTNRPIGLDGVNHLLVAGTGAGKFRDVLAVNLVKHLGGGATFSVKSELKDISAGFRAGDYRVIDPFDMTKGGSPWNILSEVDINNPIAREMLNTIAESSIFSDDGAASHFIETGKIFFRSVMGHVLTDEAYKEVRHLGTVSDLILKGDSEADEFDSKNFEKLLFKMSNNNKLDGAIIEGAGLLMSVGLRERGAILSTIRRSIEWMNSPKVRKVITGRNSFSLRDIKRKQLFVHLMIPESYLESQRRFLRTFFGMAYWCCDEGVTPQPEGSRRRCLFVIDEANTLGNFPILERALTTKRSSFVKTVVVLQNLAQADNIFSNSKNVLTSCDKQFFGVSPSDKEAYDLIRRSLGNYTETIFEGIDGQTRSSERIREVMTESDLQEFLSPSSNGQIVLPMSGLPMKLKRVPYYKVLKKGKYGKVKY